MIVAGIDEAGYGPVLGPLVVGCCAFDLDAQHVGPADVDAPVPCLWKLLRKHVSRKRPKSSRAAGRKLHVNDSKLVYQPGVGLRELERSVLTLAACAWPQWDGSQRALFEIVASHVLGELPEYPWYDESPVADPHAPTPFPHECDGLAIKLLANALRQEMAKARVACVHLAARVVLERELNRMVNHTRNKAAALFSVCAIHLDHLLRTFSDRGLIIFCDRHGGREHYGQLLRTMFDDWEHTTVIEQPSRSEYRLTRSSSSGGGSNGSSSNGGGGSKGNGSNGSDSNGSGGRRAPVVRIIFTENAERQCMSVAYASMLSKYLRESLMRRFNAYWKSHLPDLAPTAGYYNDGLRFLRDIQVKRKELGIEDRMLIRSR